MKCLLVSSKQLLTQGSCIVKPGPVRIQAFNDVIWWLKKACSFMHNTFCTRCLAPVAHHLQRLGNQLHEPFALDAMRYVRFAVRFFLFKTFCLYAIVPT